MSTELKAIETIYKGNKYRSRLEARWAVFYETLNIPYEYESQGYDLGEGLYYLPDFWMPDQDCYVEIKGSQPSENDEMKMRLLALQSDKPVFLFVGQIEPFHTELEESENGLLLRFSNAAELFTPGGCRYQQNYWCKCSHCSKYDISYCGVAGYCASEPYIGVFDNDIKDAYMKAKQARFEHGERG
jgi:hypothetical protein